MCFPVRTIQVYRRRGGGFGRVGRFGGLLDHVIYCIIVQFPGKSMKNTFPDRVIYWVILQFSLLDRAIY